MLKISGRGLLRLWGAVFLVIAASIVGATEDDPLLGLPRDRIAVSRLVPGAAELGKLLFFDKRLSVDGATSCASCHQPDKAFVDGRKLPSGASSQVGLRNAPTLLNVSMLRAFTWDGRHATLEEQALDPLLNHREHGIPDRNALIRIVRADREYRRRFASTYPHQALNADLLVSAISAFERTLLAGDSAFDRYYFQKRTWALTEAQIRGLALFVGRAGCVSCHAISNNDALFTDEKFHSLGIGMERIAARLGPLAVRYARAQRNHGSQSDLVSEEDVAELGRFVVTLEPGDIGAYRTPSLRNVALTAPYMHNGSVATLSEAVDIEIYYRGKQGRQPVAMTPADRADLVAFLYALTSNNATLNAPRAGL